MNRFNFGNVVTNGMQTLSVAGFTGANYIQNIKRQKIADASSALNNLSSEEVKAYGQMKAERIREELRQNQNKTNPMEHLSDEEQKKYGERKAEDLRNYINKSSEEEEGIDDLVSGGVFPTTPQAVALNDKVNSDLEYLSQYRIYRRDGSRFAETSVQEILSERDKGGDK